jgi:hypothetical protein
MHSEPAIERPAPRVATIAPEPVGPITEAPGGPPPPASSRVGRQPVRFVLGKVMSALHGDKYMVGAYTADAPRSSTRPEVSPGDDAATTGHAALSATPLKGG